MTHVDEITVAPRKTRWWKIALAIIVLAALAFSASLFYSHWSGARALDEAIAEADRLDPSWRLEDIEAHRAVVPDKDNSALRIIAIRKLMPPKIGEDDSLFKIPAPQVRLSKPLTIALQGELVKANAALVEARKLKDFPQGRYPITYSADFLSTLLTAQQESRRVFSLLAFDCQTLAEQGKMDEALASCRALVNAARSLGDEPMMISQLIRNAGRAVAIANIERTLAQGQPSQLALTELQKLLEDEEAAPLFLIAMRGERAGCDHLMQGLRAGTVSVPLPGVEQLAQHIPGQVSRQRAQLLRVMTQMVEAAKLPEREQRPRLEQLQDDKTRPFIVRLLVPAVSKVAGACQRTRAHLRCVIAGVAAERFRLKHGNWPDGIERLVAAGFLEKPLADPYDGQPLRWRRLQDGLVIYSIGPDGQDNQGNINREDITAVGADLGFQLWEVSRRRQPPLP
jgi:hypothetical protein